MRSVIGIDPGKNGAIASITIGGDKPDVVSAGFKDEIIGLVIGEVVQGCLSQSDNLIVYLEKVHSFPGQGVSSSFAFGRAFGEVIGALDVLGVPYRLVSPQKWQKLIGGLPKKKDGATQHKRALKVEAQRLFPQIKITLGNADALLIADYGLNDSKGTT